MLQVRLWLTMLSFAIGASTAVRAAGPESGALEHFEKKVRPLLASRCWKCHGSKVQKKDLRLDSLAGLKRHTESGVVVVPGNPDESRLVEVIRRTGDIKMPPKDSLTESEIDVLVTWIRSGAVWPEDVPTRTSGGDSLFTAEDRAHWAFQPIRDPSTPAVKNSGWVQSDVDRFILARLEATGLAPAEPANKRTLIRRVTFDLIGLPPTTKEIDDFVADESPEAFSKVVDRLLDSAHYGERWGRHWLGIVRYGDTADIAGLQASPYAFRYRDYVVNAFNRDKPYDEFVVEQLAGDLLPPTHDLSKSAERAIATGFLGLGPKPVTEIDKEKMVMEIVDEQIDVTGRAFLALTVACARCHDHKFDPIPTEDYYSLASIFYSTRSMADRKLTDSKWMERPILHVPGQEPLIALAVEDGTPTNLRVHVRGSHRNLGKEVPRRYLQILAGEGHPPIETKGSGRLELARWIASADNPLTPRVLVNRIWQGHFRSGLVTTSDNFGFTGARPSHPDLLDWLATRLIEGNWSVKAVHRLLLNTSTYQMSSQHGEIEKARQIDPDNRLLWRIDPRRLQAEEIRDTILAINGRLDRRVGGTLFHKDPRYVSAVVDASRGMWALSLPGKTYRPYYSTRRSIYLPMVRQKIPEMLHLFDFGDASAVTTKRNETTVAPQALFLLNSSFVREQSFYWARELLGLDGASDEDRVRMAHRQILGRPSDERETAAAIDYVDRYVRTLDEFDPSHSTDFSGGTVLTLVIERWPHGLYPLEETNPIIKNPNGVRLRFAVSSAERIRASRNDLADWHVLTPLSTKSLRKSALPIQPDKSVTVLGGDPTRDTYEIVAQTDVEKITAVRIEVLPDPEAPPDLSVPDLFVVGEFRVRTSPIASSGDENPPERVLTFQNATLKQSDGDLSIFPTIDNDANTSWQVGPRRDQAGIAIFETEESRMTSWQSFCRALICLNESVYLE